jgi:hypothetical protein
MMTDNACNFLQRRMVYENKGNPFVDLFFFIWQNHPHLIHEIWNHVTFFDIVVKFKANEEYIEAKEAALEKWSENICANINNARNIKDKWNF